MHQRQAQDQGARWAKEHRHPPGFDGNALLGQRELFPQATGKGQVLVIPGCGARAREHEQHVVSLDARDLERHRQGRAPERDVGASLVADRGLLDATAQFDVDAGSRFDLEDQVHDLLTDLDQARDGQLGDRLVIGNDLRRGLGAGKDDGDLVAIGCRFQDVGDQLFEGRHVARRSKAQPPILDHAHGDPAGLLNLAGLEPVGLKADLGRLALDLDDLDLVDPGSEFGQNFHGSSPPIFHP